MKLIPPLEFIDSQSSAEVRVARTLAAIDEDSGYAFYSVGLTRHEHKLRAEADFIVLWKGAVIVLEVKGGSIGRHDGVWTVSDSRGRGYSKRESPWEQASGNMFALREYLVESLPRRRFAYGILVVTPDQRLDQSLEWEKWEWAGPDAMSPKVFASALDSVASHSRRQAKIDSIPSLLDVRDALRPEFDRMRLLPDIAEAIEGQMTRLLPSQLEVLSGLEDFPRVIVEGGAGTGKTLLAVEAAKRAARDGDTVLFTCRSGGVIQQFEDDLREAAVTATPFDLIDGRARFDVVVVDEAQDIMNLDDLPKLESAMVLPLDQSKWWLFLDRNNQSRIDGAFDDDAFDLLSSSSVARYKLKFNFRNTKNIVTQVQSYLDADLGTPRIGEGPRVRSEVAESRADTDDRLTAKASRLIRDGISAHDLAFISASDSVRSVQVDGKVYEITTPRDVKGLEFKYVLVVDIDDLDAEGALPRLYIAMTRAKVELWLCMSRKAEAQVKRLVRANVERLRKG
jgi:hypothetical protein